MTNSPLESLAMKLAKIAYEKQKMLLWLSPTPALSQLCFWTDW